VLDINSEAAAYVTGAIVTADGGYRTICAGLLAVVSI